MKRSTYRVTALLPDPSGKLVRDNRYAMNSGIRRSEDMVRQYARELGMALYGDTPERQGDTYRRVWRDAEGVVRATTAVVKEPNPST